ncbi:MAG: DUF2103 domain-containing protein [Halobacteria archaeon]|nr:DUF2103 domain-containing protein [Halobacteria archaeon]
MDCRRCGASIEKPGDYCLVCRTPNADAVFLEVGRERTRITVSYGSEIVGRTTVTTVPEDDDPDEERRQIRNYAGLIVDEVRRKRVEEVYARGTREVIDEIRVRLHHTVERIRGDESVESVLDDEPAGLKVVDKPPNEKIGGSHTTLIGESKGLEAVKAVTQHPNVKKIVPGPINAAGSNSSGGFGAKVTRSDTNGNLRLLIRDGSSVQENRIVTTANDHETGEMVRDELNTEVAERGLSRG